MVPGRPNLGSILSNRGVVTEEQLKAALEFQLTTGCRLGDALLFLHICSDEEISRALAEQFEIPYVDLRKTPPSPDCMAMVPREFCVEYGVLPVRMETGRLLLAARDPFDIRVDEALRGILMIPTVLGIAPESHLRELLRQYSVESRSHAPVVRESVTPGRGEVDDDGEYAQLGQDLASSVRQHVPIEKLGAAAEQISTIRVVNTLIADAVRARASDIHIEPEEDVVRVRYRIDGRMVPTVHLPLATLPSVVARIKIMAGLDISDSRRPQDGSCRIRVGGRDIELRISTLCGIHGEVVVVRLLRQDTGLHNLDVLGLGPDVLRDWARLLAGRQGMLLVTGPTGSGKSTTLYASLNHLNTADVNVVTVEDPVEMKVRGINQVQVQDRAGRSFATTLRAMLRQDPDIIMVGEVRDTETAEIACRASLTGHLVLSTLHTPDALGTVMRLVEMGVAPWLVAGSLKGVLSQRLVRRVCQHCAEDYTPSVELLQAFQAKYGSLRNAQFRRGTGCVSCNQAGTSGRIAVLELLEMDPGFRSLVAEGAPQTQLEEYVSRRGFQSMEDDAFRKACQGLIPPEEVIALGLGLATDLLADEPAEDPVEETRGTSSREEAREDATKIHGSAYSSGSGVQMPQGVPPRSVIFRPNDR